MAAAVDAKYAKAAAILDGKYFEELVKMAETDEGLRESLEHFPETIPAGYRTRGPLPERNPYAAPPKPLCDRCQDPQPRVGALACEDCYRDIFARHFCVECDRNVHMKTTKLDKHVRKPVRKPDMEMFMSTMYYYYRNPMWALPFLDILERECEDVLIQKHCAWRLMIMYHGGYGVTRDLDLAKHYCERALQLKHVVAPGYLAYLNHDYKTAQRLLEECVEKYKHLDPLDKTPWQDGGDAFFLMAVMADKGLGRDADEKAAMDLYEKATYRRNFLSYFNMALIWWNRGYVAKPEQLPLLTRNDRPEVKITPEEVRNNQVKAFACIHKSCDSGYGPAYFVMGKFYELACGQDEDQDPDPVRAIERIEVGGDKHEDPLALYQIGEAHHLNTLAYYITGPESVTYLSKCYEIRHYPAFDLMAELYRHGTYPRLFPQNPEFAFQLVCEGADHNDRTCIFRKGQYLGLGVGCVKDEKQGVELVTKAKDMGCPEAIFELAYWTEYGMCGIPQDMLKGRDLYIEAAQLGYNVAQKLCKKRKIHYDPAPKPFIKYDKFVRFLLPRNATIW